MNAFTTSFDELPDSLPIFPLVGVLLLPRGQLPLNIFEPRYLAMVTSALGGDRMIGMIQPKDSSSNDANPQVYQTGCAGRIIRFEEMEDGRFLINLLGWSRFKIREERGLNRGFRSVIADWTPYRTDLEKSESSEFDRERLLRSLRSYFEIQGIQVDWENVQEAQDERLINMVAMACPFEPLEKQALLEAQNLTVRAETLISLIEMVVLSTAGDDSTQQ